MRLSHRCRFPLLVAAAMTLSAGPAWAESGETSRDTGALAVSAPSPVAEAVPADTPRPAPAVEATRSRPSDALMRALMLISSASGGRPFPLVPR
jgi:hypothetical protein